MAITEADEDRDTSTPLVGGCSKPRIVVRFVCGVEGPLLAEIDFATAGITLGPGAPHSPDAEGEWESADLEAGQTPDLDLSAPLATLHQGQNLARVTHTLLTPLVAAKTRIVTVPVEPLAAHLFLDADRTGDLTREGLDQWDWGTAEGNKGAIVLCNNDGASDASDNADAAITGEENLADIAPLDVRVTPRLPEAGLAIRLELVEAANRRRLRIFNGRAAGAAEIIGPGTGAGCDLLAPEMRENWDGTTLALGMEAIVFDGFVADLPVGPIRLKMTVTQRGTVISTQYGQVQVAPWMMMHHLIPVAEVFAAQNPAPDALWDNAAFRVALQGALPAGVAFNEALSGAGDRWAQDCMEFGVSCLPAHQLPCVMRAPRQEIGLTGATHSLARRGLGFFGLPFDDGTNADSDRLGNLEVTPPCTKADGTAFPFGRIYYGNCRGKRLHQPVRRMLRRQHVQAPFEIDTGFLDLGHVDEILSFVPSATAPGWKACMPEPKWALALMGIAFQIDAATPVFGGDRRVTTVDGKWPLPATVGAFLTVDTDKDFHFGASCTKAAAGIAAAKATLLHEIGLAPARIVSLPVLFGVGRAQDGGFLTGNMVNMLVVGDHCYMSRPFGPRVNCDALRAAVADGSFATHAQSHPAFKLPNPIRGQMIAHIGGLAAGGPRVDLFELCARLLLEAEGLTVHFIDTWNLYHGEGGGLHCATNSRRIPPEPLEWWTYPREM